MVKISLRSSNKTQHYYKLLRNKIYDDEKIKRSHNE